MPSDPEPIIVRSRIEPSWTDFNGHVNYAAYALAADPAIDLVLADAGLDERFRRENQRSDYVVQSRFHYFREIRGDGYIEVRARLADFDSKRAHIFCEICSHPNGELAATAHIVSVHVDTAQAKSAPFPEFALRRLAELKREHDRLGKHACFDETVAMKLRF
jgi:acyl-CoA thioester hydrolase